jgi:hypothetical protein
MEFLTGTVVDFSLDRRIELKTRRPLLERQAERGQRARRVETMRRVARSRVASMVMRHLTNDDVRGRWPVAPDVLAPPVDTQQVWVRIAHVTLSVRTPHLTDDGAVARRCVYRSPTGDPPEMRGVPAAMTRDPPANVQQTSFTGS